MDRNKIFMNPRLARAATVVRKDRAPQDRWAKGSELRSCAWPNGPIAGPITH